MPTAIAPYLAGYIGTTVAVAEVVIDVAIVATELYIAQDSARRQQNAAKNAYNASLQDRYVMTRASADPRQLVLGRQRVSGPMFYVGSYGPNQQYLVFTVALAGHEIDAVEAIYFDDEQVTLDSTGAVMGVNRRDQFSLSTASATYLLSSIPAAATLTAKVNYGAVTTTLAVSLTGDATGKQVTVTGGDPTKLGEVTISYQPSVSPYITTQVLGESASISLDASGNGSVVLPLTPIAGSIQVAQVVGSGDSQNANDLSAFVSVSGSTVTLTGVPVDTSSAIPPATVSYQTLDTTVLATVRWHLGAPGQTADAGMIADLPGVWSSAHVANSVAYLVVELNYDPNAFPNGIPNVSAQIRGAKVYDPRTNTTAWSENPAILIRAAATHPLCGRLAPSLINDASIISAANVCDVIANYPVGNLTYSLPKYTAGIVTKSGVKPADAMNDLAQAMAGKWTFIDGLLRVKAGNYVTPLQTLDETWLTDSQKIQIQPRANRADVYNTVTGKFADRQNDYQVLDFPQVSAASYITEDGTQLPLDVPLNAVTFTGQAQQVIAAIMRDARQGLRLTVLCNMRAYPVEVFDTLYVTLSRFGWTNKPFEVYDVSWTIDGGIQLSMKEVDPAAWDMGLVFADTDPAPNTLLPSPFDVAAVKTLNCQSGTAELLKQADGTIVSRICVTWDAIHDAGVLTNGGVEVRYGIFNSPDSTWQSVIAQGGQTQVFLTGVQDGQAYLVKARAFNALVQGQWCPQVLHIVIGKTAPPINVANLSATVVASGVRVSWSDDMEVDYDSTEVRVGSVWATATSLFRGTASAYNWLSPVPGTYTLLAKHYDTSGNESVTATSVSVTVTVADALQWVNLVGRPKLFRAVARGYNDTQAPIQAGFYDDSGTLLCGITRSYMLVKIRRSDSTVIFSQLYDVYAAGTDSSNPTGYGRGAAQLAADLNNTGSDTIVVVYTFDEPDSNRLTAGLSTAMCRCGASRAIFGSPQFQSRSAYVLIGIGGCGEGNGFESYSGSVNGDTNAFCDVAFTIQSGSLLVTGAGATPRTLADYSYSGDLNATYGADWATNVNGAAAVNQAITNAQTAATNAANAASTAQTNAAFALQDIANIGSDSILAAAKKSSIVLDYQVIIGGQSGIDANAVNYGISSTAFDQAVSALTAYLGTLTTPTHWDDLSGDTAMNGATLRALFAAVYSAQQALLNSISAQAKARLGALATLNQVDTPQVVASAVTEVVTFTDAVGVGYDNRT